MALLLADGAYVAVVARGDLEPAPLSLLLWPGALLILAAAASQPADVGAPRFSSWAKVGVPATSASACLPVVLLAHPGPLRNAMR